MLKVLLVGAGLAVLAGGGVALAQMPPGGGMDRMGGPDEMEQGRGPGMMPPHMYEMMHHHPHHGGQAASFRFKRGDMEIGIKCSEREPTQLCVAAASTLLDKLSNAPAPTTPPAPGQQ